MQMETQNMDHSQTKGLSTEPATLGVFDLKRRCAEWSVYDIQTDPYAFE